MLQDVMERAGLEGFAELGLVMFVIAFVSVLIRVWLLDGDEAERRAEIPFGDESDEESLP